MTPSTLPREATIQCLIEAGLNHLELSQALEVSGQTARGYLREYRVTRSLSRERSRSMGSGVWNSTRDLSLTRLWSMGEAARCE